MESHERAPQQQQQDAGAPLAALAVAAAATASSSTSPPLFASLSLNASNASDAQSSAQTPDAAMAVQTEQHAPATDASRDTSATHHATNLLHEAVEREQKLREDSARQQRQSRDPEDTDSDDDDDDDDALERELDAAPLQDTDPQAIPVVRNSSPETVQPEATQYGDDVRNKNIPDLYYLFTNDKLKEEPLTKVLHSDPFVIPRLTDNVPEYRPAFNPLSILEGEEKLLPRYFRLDPFEGIPGVNGAGGKSSKDAKGDHARTHHDKTARAAMGVRSKTAGASGANSSNGSSASAGPFVGKTSTFMGTLPRQSEFSEIPVADTIFQPQPPPPPAPHPSYASKNLSILRSTKDWADTTAATSASVQQQQQSAPATSAPSVASTLSSTAPVTPTALTDAMFLTSLHHQSGAEQQSQSQMPPYARSDYGLHSYYGSSSSSAESPAAQQQQSMYHHHAPPDHEPSGSGDKLTRYLPARSPVSSSSMYDDVYVGGDPQSQLPYAPSAATPYSASMYSEYRDSAMTDPSALPGTTYDYAGLPQQQQQQALPSQQTGGDTQSLQPISKKPRSKNVFRPCTAPGCTKGARGKSGLCQKHGGGKRCAMPNCAKGAQGSSTMCLFHGGGYRCTVDGCTTGARGTSGLCAKHGGYKRSASGGKDASGRTSGSASPTGSHSGGNSGKRARTSTHSPMDFDTDGASARPVTPRFESMLFG